MSSSEYTPPSPPADCQSSEFTASSSSETDTTTTANSTDSDAIRGPPPAKRKKKTSSQISRSTLRRRINFDGDSNGSYDEVTQSPQRTNTEEVCPEFEPCNDFVHESFLNTSSSSSSSSSTFGLDANSGSGSEATESEIGHSTDSECSVSDSISEDSLPGIECSNISDCESDESDDDFLYEGSSVTTNQAILKVLKVYISQRKTKACLNADVKLTKSLLPEPNSFPSSAKNLLKKLEQLSPFQKEIPHHFCSLCKSRKISEVEECSCGHKSTSSFYEFSVEDQIRYMFEHRDLASAIDSYRSQRVSKAGCTSDIQDGTEYCRVRSSLKDKYDVVLMLNTDGVQLSKSSKNELWALLSVICEVSPQRRLSYIVVSGIFVAHEKPDMNLFLKPLVQSLKLIASNNGISWTHPTSKTVHKSKIACPCLCADAPAKAMVLKVKTFSHRYGCNICEQKAVKVKIAEEECTNEGEMSHQQNKRKKKTKKRKRRQTTLRRFVFQEHPAALRTDARMNLQGELAEERGKSRKGVVGKAEVCGLPYFDRGKGVCAEYMHTVMLGTVKYFLSIFTTEKGPWNISKNINEIDKFVKTIKVPDFIKRLPRGLSDLPYLKASELRAFLLFYSLPALENYLPQEYFQHWLLLVAAIYLLLKESISDDDLNACEIMQRVFVRDIAKLYHKKFYTYNVHNLLHLPLLVRRWGPLWATSAFDFESFNGYITSHVHGTKHLDKEFLNNIKIIQSVVVFERLLETDSMPRRLNNIPLDETKVCGSSLTMNVLDNFELFAIQQQNIFNFEIFDRISSRKVIYTSRHYDFNKKRSNSIVQFKVGGIIRYGEISHFIKNTDNGKILCLINVFRVNHVDLFFHEESLVRIRHILPVKHSGELLLVSLCCLVTKVLKAGKYLCLRPNPYEVNM